MSFPIAAELYLRQKEIDKLEAKYGRVFKKKTAIVVEIVKRLVPKFKEFGKPIEIIVDGGYAKDTVLLPLGKLDNVFTTTRLRRDAVVFEIPPPPPKRGRGRPRLYGDRMAMKPMVESDEGWEKMTGWLWAITPPELPQIRTCGHYRIRLLGTLFRYVLSFTSFSLENAVDDFWNGQREL